MYPALNIAIKAARKAAKIINRASLDLHRIEISNKSQNDFVTEVDRAAEKAIIDVLVEAYPDYDILAEESGLTNAKKSKTPSEFMWIIDPLDGTTNFIHGLPQYSVSIALMKNGQPFQAVVFDPTNNELFTASRGGGAFLNDTRIRVSGRSRLKECLIGTGFPFRQGDNVEDYLAIFREFNRNVAGIRRPGSAALDLAYLACGRYDGFWEFALSPWDIAAGILLVQEAGGIISDTAGKADYLESGNVIAATPKIFAYMQQTVEKFWQR